jgi:tellurite resistance protein TerC
MDEGEPEAAPGDPQAKTSLAAQLRRGAWRLIILVVGGSVLAVGVAMIVLPGPAFVVIPAGLAILATEFVWARRLLRRVRDYASNVLGTDGGKGGNRG